LKPEFSIATVTGNHGNYWLPLPESFVLPQVPDVLLTIERRVFDFSCRHRRMFSAREVPRTGSLPGRGIEFPGNSLALHLRVLQRRHLVPPSENHKLRRQTLKVWHEAIGAVACLAYAGTLISMPPIWACDKAHRGCMLTIETAVCASYSPG
jgi:hypothetical protein